MSTQDNTHDAIVHRLQAIQPFTIQQIDTTTGTPSPWAQVTGPSILRDVVINPHSLRDQVDTISGFIAHWGRLVAQTRRVWQVHDRRYRHWRSTIELQVLKEGIEGLDKKPTVAAIEAHYRSLPEYAVMQTAIEDAEEAYNSAVAIFEAFKEKASQLRRDVRFNQDGSVTRFTA